MQDALFGERQCYREIPAIDAGLLRLGSGKDARRILDEPRIAKAPVLWARIDSPDEAQDWQRALESLPHESVMLFNAAGSLLGVGGRKENTANIVSLFQRLPPGGLDLAFFAASAAPLLQEFRGR
jgi:hypothetical protein